MTNLKKFFMLLFIAALVVGGMGFAPRSTASAATCTQYYTVKHGDTLSGIGVAFGVPWQTLAQWNNLANPRLIYAGQTLCVSMSGTTTPPPPPTGTIPTITITAVVTNTSVSIKTHNFPANDTFNVLMGTYGTAAVNGTKVGTLASGAGGTLTATYNIPSNLVGRSKIAIRLESPTSGYFAYNWFWNSTTGGSTGGGGIPGYSGFPTFSIASVVRNTSVTISGVNFPPNDAFTVTMGPMGTKGIGGYVVGTLNTGAGGSLTATYSIPAALAGSTQISIRAQSPTSGYFAYNWFWNNTYP